MRFVSTSRGCVLEPKLWCSTCVIAGASRTRGIGLATQLREDAHRYRETNGVQIMVALRSLAMNALRIDRFWSITEGLAALADDSPGLLALLGWRKPAQALSSAWLLMNPE